eukprot:8421609-Pyramimonas_sp.AAC.1
MVLDTLPLLMLNCIGAPDYQALPGACQVRGTIFPRRRCAAMVCKPLPLLWLASSRAAHRFEGALLPLSG